MDHATDAEMDVQSLAAMRGGTGAPVLLDVREGWELAIVKFPEALHIPLGELTQRKDEIPIGKPLVVLCHHGGRSLRATQWLRKNGFPDALNLRGGIDAYATKCATDMERY